MKKIFWVFSATILLLITTPVEAKQGCCSHHGGVVGCSSSGQQICADGTLSPSCTCTPLIIYGCTDPHANNYNANANRNNGSCTYDKKGCIDQSAINYDINANISDGSCLFEILKEEMEIIEYQKIYKENESLKYNEQKIVQKGEQGELKITYKVIVDENGKEISREKQSEEVIKNAIDEQIETNTKITNSEEDNSSNEKIETDNLKGSTIFIFLYIIVIIFNLYALSKIDVSETIIFKIKLNKTNFKWLYYVIYYILIIPVFIDAIFILYSYIKFHTQ